MTHFVALLMLLGCISMHAGEAETPKVVQDQLNALKPDLDKAKAEYAKKLNGINAKLVTAIQTAMTKETKAGNLDNALALKAALEKAKAGEYIDRILSQSAADLLGEDEPGYPLPAGKYTLSGKCDDRATVYVNGKQVLDCSADEAKAEIQIQDRISIMAKCFDGGGGFGLSLKVVDATGRMVIATQTNGRWKAYTPTNEAKWWVVDAQSKMRPALAGRCDWLIDGANPIWAEETLRDCYLVFGR